jgi:hypothetical protein
MYGHRQSGLGFIWPWDPEWHTFQSSASAIAASMPHAAAPLPPAGALDPSQANTLDPTTTDPSAVTRANIDTSFNSLPSTETDSAPAASSNTIWWILGSIAAALILESTSSRR